MKIKSITQEIGKSFTFESATQEIYISCYSKSNRNGFKHYTDFISITQNFADGSYKFIYPLEEEGRKELKAQYYNRTWERYTFQSLLYQIIEWLRKNKYITDADATTFRSEIENKN